MSKAYNKYAHSEPDYIPAGMPRKKPPPASGGGVTAGLKALLPPELDTSDLMLLGLMYFLYKESGDEDFIIILAVLAINIFTGN